MLTVIKSKPMMAPQGHGPLGGRSRSRLGIQPVAPIKIRGTADILAILAPERDQNSRKRMARTCSTPLIVNGNPEGGKVTSV
jgi:hypothetical protein